MPGRSSYRDLVQMPTLDDFLPRGSGPQRAQVHYGSSVVVGERIRPRWTPLPHQTPPVGRWRGWALLGGRGCGKTDACTAYVNQHATGPPCLNGPHPHWIGIIAPTLGDAVTSCVNGPSGILAHNPAAKLVSSPGGLVVRWPNGAEAKLFGASTPDDIERLRSGGNRCLVMAEELAAWRHLDEAWSHMRFGLRAGPRPHWVAATTPKPRMLIKQVDRGEMRDVIVSRATTNENPHLPEDIREDLFDTYGGTALGIQELEGRIIEQDPGALWRRENIARDRLIEIPKLKKITVGVDPSGGAGEQGIVVVGRADMPTRIPGLQDERLRPHGYVLADRSCHLSPNGWGREAVVAAIDFEADDICVEINFGGDMAVSTIRGAAEALGIPIPIRQVRASRGKRVRAEPVSALSEEGRQQWHHVGTFEQLEDQLCLVKDTTVWTARGQIPVQDVEVGELVMTRAGWKPVRWAGVTGVVTALTTVHVQDGILITCTPSHPVHLQASDRFVAAKSVQPGDLLSVGCSMGSSAIPWRGAVDGGGGWSAAGTDTRRGSSFITRSGKHTTVPYQPSTSFITSTMIPTTTDSSTSSPSHTRSMSKSTAVPQRCDDAPTSLVRLDQLDRQSVALSGHGSSRRTSPVRLAERRFSRLEHAPCVVPRAVLDVATETVRPTPVYNLTVADQPEFFAGGVLVHNCTWTPDLDWSPDRLDAMVWPPWHQGIVSPRRTGTKGSYAGREAAVTVLDAG